MVNDATALDFAGLCKRYGKTEALSSLTLKVQAGRTFGLVGANGAGKTTLIKCMLDFCSFDEGKISIFGVASSRTEARNCLAFLPERFVPPYYLTGKDFLRYMAGMYGRDFNLEACVSTIASLDLEPDMLTKPVRSLSKGMTQKLGIASCLLSGRELYVLDEPASGLDPKARALFKTAIKSARSNGSTIFLTSHALADVDEICDEMAILHQGTVRFAGSPAALKRQHGTDNLEKAYLDCIRDS